MEALVLQRKTPNYCVDCDPDDIFEEYIDKFTHVMTIHVRQFAPEIHIDLLEILESIYQGDQNDTDPYYIANGNLTRNIYARSTSMGDIIALKPKGAEPLFFLINSIGFSEVEMVQTKKGKLVFSNFA